VGNEFAAQFPLPAPAVQALMAVEENNNNAAPNTTMMLAVAPMVIDNNDALEHYQQRSSYAEGRRAKQRRSRNHGRGCSLLPQLRRCIILSMAERLPLMMGSLKMTIMPM
jgi:hypothetical protein